MSTELTPPQNDESRPYHSPLRDRRAAETREGVLETLAAIIAERGSTDFSVQEVADQAGVSLRTVYRYYPSRQELLDGVTSLVDQRLGDLRSDNVLGWKDLRDKNLDDLLATVPAVFERFDELDPLSVAMVLLSVGGRRQADSHARRTDVFRRLLEAELDGVEPDEVDRIVSVCRHLLSSATWFALREEFGVDGRAAGEIAGDAVAALVSEKRARAHRVFRRA